MTVRNLTIAFAITAAIALVTPFASPVQATVGSSVGKLAPRAPSLPVEPAACGGPGPHCPPHFHWVCGPYGHRCWCTPC